MNRKINFKYINVIDKQFMTPIYKRKQAHL